MKNFNSKKRIILIGPQHVGKSSVGTILSESLQLSFFDSDQLILDYISFHESKTFTSIRELYKNLGKERFQKIEFQVLKELPPTCVCATGGGLANNKSAYKILSHTQKILLLSTSDIVWNRIITQGIPAYLSTIPIEKLSKSDIIQLQKNFNALFEKRMKIYTKIADITINTINKTPMQITKDILSYFTKEKFC